MAVPRVVTYRISFPKATIIPFPVGHCVSRQIFPGQLWSGAVLSGFTLRCESWTEF